jgi:hypothetical protein
MLRDDSRVLRLHGLHDEGWLHVLSHAEQHPSLLRLLVAGTVVRPRMNHSRAPESGCIVELTQSWIRRCNQSEPGGRYLTCASSVLEPKHPSHVAGGYSALVISLSSFRADGKIT